MKRVKVMVISHSDNREAISTELSIARDGQLGGDVRLPAVQSHRLDTVWKEDALHVQKPSDWPGIVAARVQSAMDTACHVTALNHLCSES